MKSVHVLFENESWMPPLRQALSGLNLPVVEHYVEGGTVDIAEAPPQGVFINRMSPSAHTRGHQGGVQYVRELLGVLEAAGRPIINGSKAFSFEVSKVRQHAALQAFGIDTPRTIAVIGGDDALKSAARRFEGPFITKHNQGGKGLGVQLFRSHEAFDDYIDAGSLEASPDGVMLLQQYIVAPEPFITRVEIVDGEFQYAIRSSTENGFELCPADACSVDAAFCPVDADDSATGTSTFDLRPEITADDPLVKQLIAFCNAHQIGVAGIEFIEDESGKRYTYDINGTSNYNGTVEEKYGLSGMNAIARLAQRLLAEA